MKDFVARSKAKAKPQRREPVDLPSIIPMNERKWIDIEPGESSTTLSKQYNEKTTEQFNSGRSRIIFGINFHKYNSGQTIVGYHACQQEEDQKGDISTALIFQK